VGNVVGKNLHKKPHYRSSSGVSRFNCKSSICRFSKRSHTVEVQIAMRYKRIENLSDHLQSNFHK